MITRKCSNRFIKPLGRSLVPQTNSQIRQFSIDHNVLITTFTNAFQNLHEFTGLPWWALIPITTFTLRSIWTLPLAIIQRKRIQKQSSLKPIISAMGPILRMNLAKKVSNANKVIQNPQTDETTRATLAPMTNMTYEQILLLSTKETRKRQKQLFKKYNVQLWKNFILPVFQIPLWVIMSITMRDLSGWSSWDNLHNKALDPTLYSEGCLWFQDLAVADPTHVFPLILGVISLCNIEWTFKTLDLARLTQKLKYRPTITDAIANFSRLSIVFMMAISIHAPAALVLYWISSQFYSLIQNIVMDLKYPISYSPRKRFGWEKSSYD
ncbi:COX18 [Candida pseudojiufengensis]|uniref:COX18 n=1 Tax=Candida pseudojiufengensis TaxID=497109 RepID=UPI00222461C9|nr:COX18 [Candida pseudojiufengensis]KAI5964331.1 COX18 [Candida pseudojiufengensis]